MAGSRFRFALIGAGRIGRQHLKSLVLNQRSSVKYIVEEDTKIAKEMLYKYKLESSSSVLNADNLDRVYEDKEVDAVMICSPSKTHEKFVKESLAVGKGVFCEKPLALSIQSVKDCYDAAEKAKRPLFVAFQRRFDPQLNKMWHDIRRGKIGPVRLVRSTSRDPPGMTTKEYLIISGGIFVDSAVHDIDMVNWLVGEVPETVYATGYASHPLWQEVGDVDTSAALFTYPSGAVAMIDNCRNAPVGYDQRVESFGSKGMLQSYNRKEMDLDYRSSECVKSTPIFVDFMKRYDMAYGLELDHFLNVLEEKEECIVTRESTLAVNLIAEACTESMKTKKIIHYKDFAAKYS